MTILLAISALLIHEFGHCLGSWMCGLKVTGAVISWRGIGIKRRPGTAVQNFTVTAAGPLLSLMVGLSFWGTMFGLLNLVVAITTFVPLKDSDGDKLMEALSTPKSAGPNLPVLVLESAPRHPVEIVTEPEEQPVPLRRAA